MMILRSEMLDLIQDNPSTDYWAELKETEKE